MKTQFINDSVKYDNLYSFDMGRLALCVPQVKLGYPLKNAETMLSLIEKAKVKGAFAYIFPELSLSGYSLDDLFLQSWLHDQCN